MATRRVEIQKIDKMSDFLERLTQFPEDSVILLTENLYKDMQMMFRHVDVTCDVYGKPCTVPIVVMEFFHYQLWIGKCAAHESLPLFAIAGIRKGNVVKLFDGREANKVLIFDK